MKRHSARTPAAIPTAIALGCWVTAVAAPATRSADSLQSQAERIVRHIAERRFDQVVAAFDDKMGQALSADLLASVWAGQIIRFGRFLRVDEPNLLRRGRTTIASAVVRFHARPVQLLAVFDRQRRVSGLWLHPGPPYARPAAFRETSVTLGPEGIELPGLITIPDGKGPVAGVVLVHGSGPHDFNESVGAAKPFLDLAWGLANRGVAVLRYDKRTLVYRRRRSKWPKSVRQEVIDDAVAAVELLAGHPAVDPGRVFVAGHSLGATLAPEIAETSGRVAGVIMLAPSARPLTESMVEQLEYALSLPGAPKERLGKQLAVVRKGIQAIQDRTLRPGQFFFGAGPAYWYDLEDHLGPAAVHRARRLSIPLLIMAGGRDYQVTDRDFNIWKSALADHENATLMLFEDANHLFVAGKGRSTPDEYKTPGHVERRVVEAITRWIAARRP